MLRESWEANAKTKESVVLYVLSMLNKNTYGSKKGEANQKQQLSDYSCD